MAESSRDRPNEFSVGVNLSTGQAKLLARNLSDRNLRWVIAGLGGGALSIWFLKELGEFVLRLVELQLQYAGS